MFSNADEVLKYLKDNDVKSVDVRFCDLPGVMQHFTVPVESFGADVFANVRSTSGSQESYYHIDAEAAFWNTGRAEEGGNRGYKPRVKGGYFPVAPNDHYADLRATMSRTLIESGLLVERQHHEVGSAGQAGINYKI